MISGELKFLPEYVDMKRSHTDTSAKASPFQSESTSAPHLIMLDWPWRNSVVEGSNLQAVSG